jgi:hypothetical protein
MKNRAVPYWSRVAAVAAVVIFLLAPSPGAAETEPDQEVGRFLELLVAGRETATEALRAIERDWDEGYVPMTLETLRLTRNPAVHIALIQLLEEKTGQAYGFDLNGWYAWLWNREQRTHPSYAAFKSQLYRLIDPKFAAYFDPERSAKIRLDEVVWGGVAQDGIPPLRQPRMIPASEADYLDDGNVVFALEINGDARAYPKRIMAWHEMFVDEVGGVPVTGAYCTLCGSMVLYHSVIDGVEHELGTSGFLYRSNKLMYDRATQSLWNTLWGVPVIGPLAERDIRLERLSIITTTWGEWRRRHSETKVLSLDTGYVRDYSEGAAYREYFATDELMFGVPTLDGRLKNKDEVLGLVLAPHHDQPLAISAAYLAANPLYHDQIGTMRFVVLTDNSGANRVYEAGNVTFSSWDGVARAVDDGGGEWLMKESGLTGPEGQVLHRLPAHRAFWFGWYAAYSHTRLVH